MPVFTQSVIDVDVFNAALIAVVLHALRALMPSVWRYALVPVAGFCLCHLPMQHQAANSCRPPVRIGRQQHPG
jgi:hypothetical protein